jgi:hypothetical protein
MLKSNTNMLPEKLNIKKKDKWPHDYLLWKKTSTFLDETIHITFGWAMYLHGHRNNVVPLMKPFIFADLYNGAKFYNSLASRLMTFKAIVSALGQ